MKNKSTYILNLYYIDDSTFVKKGSWIKRGLLDNAFHKSVRASIKQAKSQLNSLGYDTSKFIRVKFPTIKSTRRDKNE